MIRDKKKVIIFTSLILGVLVVTLGITYSLFTFNETGGTSKLILGDIYMHYKETNQLSLSDAMPLDINKYTTYKVNPIMQEQSIDYKNELTACVLFYSRYPFDEGSTAESFCQGTGTAFGGDTIQEDLDYLVNDFGDDFLEEDGQALLDAGVILSNGDGTYTVNPIMQEQSVEEVNELTTCVSFYTGRDYEFDEGSAAESFCQGTGMAWGGLTIQEDLDDWISWAESESTIEEGFLNDGGQQLLDAGVILHKIENLPYFEFTISGKNTYTKEDIWYEIVLSHGSDHDTRTTRIRDDLLKFTLIEVVNGNNNILVDNKSYSDLTNKRIYVDTIDADTKTEISRTYRLYMWISDETVLGNVDEDYTLEEWNDVFASIKVNVSGDFEEKIVYTDESCFATEVINTYTHNSNMTEGEINNCVTYLNDVGISSSSGTMEEFCQGTGTVNDYTFQELLYNEWFSEEKLTYFEENNIIIGTDSMSISDYDARCGTDIVIPKTINGYDVTMIGYEAFADNRLTSVVIPNSVIIIGNLAFYENQLTSVTFEDDSKLTFIYSKAFRGDNQVITEVTIPDSVAFLDCKAFNDDVIINKRDDLVCKSDK